MEGWAGFNSSTVVEGQDNEWMNDSSDSRTTVNRRGVLFLSAENVSSSFLFFFSLFIAIQSLAEIGRAHV